MDESRAHSPAFVVQVNGLRSKPLDPSRRPMSALSLASIPLAAENPSQLLRRIAAAVRVHFTWWGVHKTLTAQQKEKDLPNCESPGQSWRR